MPPSIGIIGGMGPWVDPLLLRKLLECQAALGMRRDQDAIPTLLAQYAVLIEDRTKYLAAPAGENPAVRAARIAHMLARNGAAVIGIPCNTFHAEPIFSRFEQETAGLRVVHMIRATLADLLAARPGLRRIGILSTNGTYLHRIYSAPVEAAGLEAITLPFESGDVSQSDVHEAIVNPEWGIKSGRDAAAGYPAANAVLKRAAQRLAEMGTEVVILGCTEIPLALTAAEVPLYDPLDSLARGLVNAYRKGIAANERE